MVYPNLLYWISILTVLCTFKRSLVHCSQTILKICCVLNPHVLRIWAVWQRCCEQHSKTCAYFSNSSSAPEVIFWGQLSKQIHSFVLKQSKHKQVENTLNTISMQLFYSRCYYSCFKCLLKSFSPSLFIHTM